MNAQKKISLNINCPQCKKKMQADYDMSDYFLDGECGSCGHKLHSHSPKIAEKIQAKILERKKANSSVPGAQQSTPERSSGAMQNSAIPAQVKRDIGSVKPETLQLVPDAALDNTENLNDGDKKPDIFALVLNIAAIILVVIYLLTFTLDGIINWVVISVPVVALSYVWFSNGRIGLFQPGNGALNTMLVAMLFPAIAFALVLAGTVHVLDYAKLWIPLVVTALITTGIFYYIAARSQQVSNMGRVLALACAMIFAYGLVMFVNSRFDTSGAISMQDPVLAKYSKRDYSGSAILYAHFITIPPIKSGNSEPDKIGVSGGFYDYIKPGKDVLVEQMHGFLKIPWYKVESTDRVHPVY